MSDARPVWTAGSLRGSFELRRTTDGVEGQVVPDDGGPPLVFSSWLELLCILEPPAGDEAGGWDTGTR
jgi:hypothetical protein